MLWRSDGVRNLLRGWLAEVLPRFLPALLEGSERHWNSTVLTLIGVVLGLLEEMTLSSGDEPESGARLFEQGCVDCKTTAEAVRAKALELNPPADAAAIAAARSATEGAIKKRQDDKSFNIYSVALGHELAVGTFSRVRFGKLILKGLDQSLWPEVAVKIQERAVSVLSNGLTHHIYDCQGGLLMRPLRCLWTGCRSAGLRGERPPRDHNPGEDDAPGDHPPGRLVRDRCSDLDAAVSRAGW